MFQWLRWLWDWAGDVVPPAPWPYGNVIRFVSQSFSAPSVPSQAFASPTIADAAFAVPSFASPAFSVNSISGASFSAPSLAGDFVQ